MLLRTKSFLERALGPDIARGLEGKIDYTNHFGEVQNENEVFNLWQLGLNQGAGV